MSTLTIAKNSEYVTKANFSKNIREKLKAVLKEKGLNVPNEYLDEEGLVEWLWTSVLNK